MVVLTYTISNLSRRPEKSISNLNGGRREDNQDGQAMLRQSIRQIATRFARHGLIAEIA